MKTLFLTTSTRDCEKLWQSYINLGHLTNVVSYDHQGLDLIAIARECSPEVIIYIGAVAERHNACVPEIATLEQLGKLAPMIHLCSDAADWPWWPILDDYETRKIFVLQIAIDGSFTSPINRIYDRGFSALTPIDPNMFHPRPWRERSYDVGFVGYGNCRTNNIYELQRRTSFTWLNNGHEVPYQALCDFYSDCKIVWNMAHTGSGAFRHVKGRVVEAGLAGAVLLEASDSPLSLWLERGVDYLSWETVDEAARWIDVLLKDAPLAERLAQRLHEKIVQKHAADVFWGRVLSIVQTRSGK